MYTELSTSYGKIEELHVCDNLNEHMLGNVYCKFEDEEDAEKALRGLTGRFFAGRPLHAEYSPVTDFREARYILSVILILSFFSFLNFERLMYRCRQHEDGQCTRGGYCNFMHLMSPSQPTFYRCFPNGR